MSDNTYDYIVVGAGGAGAVLADRLSEDPKTSVLLIEQGPPAVNPFIYIPKGFYYLIRNPKLVKPYKVLGKGDIPYEETWLRGTVLGGSTSVNGMMYIRGERGEHEKLAAMTSEEWGWDRFLDAYTSFEDHNLGASDMRGAGGPLGITVNNDDNPLMQKVFAAAAKAGIPWVEDINAHEGEHIGATPETIKNAIRQSTANTFLKRAKKRSNLTIVTDTKVGFLRFDGNRVIGVRARHKGRMTDYTARRDVVLCGSNLENPLLLERSGIGRGDVLKAAGVRQRVESPDVGENLLEQHITSLQVKLKRDLGGSTELGNFAKQMMQGARWMFTRTGPIGRGLTPTTAHIKSRPDVDEPDIQLMFNPVAMDPENPYKVANYPGLGVSGYQITPSTASSLHITGKNPDDIATIESSYYDSGEDREVVGAMFDRMREILAQSPIAEEIEVEQYPGPLVTDAVSARKYSLSPGVSCYHGVGSVRMGKLDTDPVDPQTLKVRGVEGLRVADISILPRQISGNTAAPASAIGWIAADVITRS